LPHPTLAIANEFLGRAFEEGRGLTQMQLQKLVYLAHGWNLAVNGEQLVEDEFEAWSYGPVLRRLYDATRIYSNNKIPALLKWGQDTPFRSDDGGDALTNLDDKERSVIDEVWELYGKFPAFKLSALTHVDGSPWANYYEFGKNRKVSNDKIEEYFVNLSRS
jgi:uncharacterized phage-associated protein